MSTNERDPFAFAGEHPLDPVAEAAARWRATVHPDPAIQAIAEWTRLANRELPRPEFLTDAFCAAQAELDDEARQFWTDVVAKVKPTTLAGAIELLRVINDDDMCHGDIMDTALSALAEMGLAGVPGSRIGRALSSSPVQG